MCQARQRTQSILCVWSSPITKHGANLAGKIQTVLSDNSIICSTRRWRPAAASCGGRGRSRLQAALWGCPIRQLLGLGCPLCGFSRALLAALRLDFPAAFGYHPLWPVFPPALVLSVWLEGRRPGSAKPLGLAVLLLALAVYALRLSLRDPVVFPQLSS